uniref:Capsid protein n=1 Tax=Wenling japanese thread-sail fish astrovirus TaxID=2116334 RepID=A0A2P1GNG7_9VIRU|nr:capsid protein [Wenling japanese thread-sail fish astrovirus]
MSGIKPTRREPRRLAAAERKGQPYIPPKNNKKGKKSVQPRKTNGKTKTKSYSKITQPSATMPWARAGPIISGGMRSGTVVSSKKNPSVCEFEFVVGKVNGSQDDWITPYVVSANPRVLAKLAKVPKLDLMASMHQKYKIKSMTLQATPTVSAAIVTGSVLFLSEGGSANSPMPPENVNTCKDRQHVAIDIGSKGEYTWKPPTREYLCRPDGDVSETSPGCMYVQKFLSTENLMSTTEYTKSVWLVSCRVTYEFSVFEDPQKNTEDAIVSEPLTGKLTLKVDANGAPILVGDTVSALTGRLKPNGLLTGTKVGNVKNGVLIASGIISTALDLIPGPLGILIRAGAAVVKYVLASVRKTSGNGEETDIVPALKIYGSVDDALEERPLSAPGLTPTDVSVDGSLTTLTVGQNPINADIGNTPSVAEPQIYKATGPTGYMCMNSFNETAFPTLTPLTGGKGVLKIDNVGTYTATTSGWSQQISKDFKVIMMNTDGNIWYDGPIVGCPSNAVVDGKRCIGWVSKQVNPNSGSTVNFVCYKWDHELSIRVMQPTGMAANTLPLSVYSGFTGTSKYMWTSGANESIEMLS